MLGYIKVPRIEEAFDWRNLLPSTALDQKKIIHNLISNINIILMSKMIADE